MPRHVEEYWEKVVEVAGTEEMMVVEIASSIPKFAALTCSAAPQNEKVKGPRDDCRVGKFSGLTLVGLL